MQYTDFLLLHIHATYKISNFTHKVFMYINILFFLLFMGGGSYPQVPVAGDMRVISLLYHSPLPLCSVAAPHSHA